MRFPCDRCGAEYLVAGTTFTEGRARRHPRPLSQVQRADRRAPALIDGRYRVVGDLGTTRLGILYTARDEERRAGARCARREPGDKGARVSVLAAKSAIDVERARVSIGITHPLIASVLAVDESLRPADDAERARSSAARLDAAPWRDRE